MLCAFVVPSLPVRRKRRSAVSITRSAHIDRKFGDWPVLAGTTLVAACPSPLLSRARRSALAERLACCCVTTLSNLFSSRVDAQNSPITVRSGRNRQIGDRGLPQFARECVSHRCCRWLLRRRVRHTVCRVGVVPVCRRWPAGYLFAGVSLSLRRVLQQGFYITTSTSTLDIDG